MSLILTACASTQKFIFESLANTKFDDSHFEEELSRKGSDSEYPFSLNCRKNYGCPTIAISIDGKRLLFQVDTGSENNLLYNGGIKKLYGNVESMEEQYLQNYIDYMKENFPEKVKDQSEKQLRKMFHSSLTNFNINITIHNSFSDFIYVPQKKGIDGIIGQNFMKKHKRVTFDFINNLLIFDNERINGSAIPFIKTDYELIFVDFLYKDKREYGIIDTGNYTFSPRTDFGRDGFSFDFKKNSDYSLTYKGNIKKRFPQILTFDGIKIGDVEYNNIKGIYSNIWFSTYNKGAQSLLCAVNGIGCEFFKNHIIQFDYTTNEFIIN